jgi:hypothetical protein
MNEYEFKVKIKPKFFSTQTSFRLSLEKNQEKMTITFENLKNHKISLQRFLMNYRFTEEKHHILPDAHLEQLIPLDDEGAKFLWDFIKETKLHGDVPFKKEFFKVIDKAAILPGDEENIRKWLYRRGFAFDKEVILSWTPTEAMIVPWKLFVKYYDSFFYAGSDDLTIIDRSLNWALLFYHEDEIYFGTNLDFTPSNDFPDYQFCW